MMHFPEQHHLWKLKVSINISIIYYTVAYGVVVLGIMASTNGSYLFLVLIKVVADVSVREKLVLSPQLPPMLVTGLVGLSPLTATYMSSNIRAARGIISICGWYATTIQRSFLK